MDFVKEKSWNIKTTKTFYQKSAGLRLLQMWSNLKKNLDKKWQLMSSFIQAREKGAKKAKKGLKNGLDQNKSCNIKRTKPFIKNRLGYVCYRGDPI